MASTIKVLALPRDGWKDDDERQKFQALVRSGNPRGFYVIFDFRGVDDPVSRLQDLIDTEGSNPCLESLEIWARGNPLRCDNLTVAQAVTWGQKLQTIVSWCDESQIYLAGCNTGLTHVGQGPVAKVLADAMAFDANRYAVHLRVYSSNGYLTSNNAIGNEKTTYIIVTRGQRVRKFFRFVWGVIYSGGRLVQGLLEAGTVDVEHTPYPGCEEKTGDDVWIECRNWS